MVGIRKIIFVCTGNTCRSPMAEGIFRKYYQLFKGDISSRGIMVEKEYPANEQAIDTMDSLGIDLRSHISRIFDEDEILYRTIVLTMTTSQKIYLINKYPKLINQVHTLHEYLGQKGEIQDPYGMSKESYVACAIQLKKLLKELIKTIKKMEEQR